MKSSCFRAVLTHKGTSVRKGDSEKNQSIWVTSAKLGSIQAYHKKRC